MRWSLWIGLLWVGCCGSIAVGRLLCWLVAEGRLFWIHRFGSVAEGRSL